MKSLLNTVLMVLCQVCFGLFFNTPVEASDNCDYFASPDGLGTGLTKEDPLLVSEFYSRAVPGDTLCLLDGEYLGSDSLINFSGDCDNQKWGGTLESVISIQSYNDGKAILNGEKKLIPVRLNCVQNVKIIGINAHSSSGNVVSINNSKNVALHKIVAWDAAIDSNSHVFSINNVEDSLLEDIAGFGSGRKILQFFKGRNLTARRVFARWEGSTYVGPKMAIAHVYNSYDFVGENLIATWDELEMPSTYTLICPEGMNYSKCGTSLTTVDQPYGIIATDRLDDDKKANSRILGSIAYLDNNSDIDSTTDILFNAIRVNWSLTGVHFRDSVIAYGENISNAVKVLLLSNFRDLDYSELPDDSSAHNLTIIGEGAVSIGPEWETSNIDQQSDISTIEDQMISNSNGADVCFRYVNGIKTDQPLWPWPMNQRIIEAMESANKEPVDVTHTISRLIGPIPEQCSDIQPEIHLCQGDLNGDKIVNIIDFILFSSDYLSDSNRSDFNSDGIVNSSDFIVFSVNYLKKCL